jgi:uncharacterized membrane protein YhiD involved in acid resistance
MGTFDWNWVLLLDYAARLFLAALVGSIIAFRRSPDRYQSNLIEAHAFLSTAGALFMIIIAGEIIRAVGLLGAASVVRYRYAIRNPRDAGTLIVSLGLGMACGSGMAEVAVIGAIFILIVSRMLSSFYDLLPFSVVRRREEVVLRIQTENYATTMAKVEQLFRQLDIHYELVSFEKKIGERRGPTTEIDLKINYGANLVLKDLTDALMDENVHRLSWQDIPEPRA